MERIRPIKGNFPPEIGKEYLFEVITPEGENIVIDDISVDPKRPDTVPPFYSGRFSFPFKETIEAKATRFREYVNWFRKKYGKNPQYKKALELLEAAKALVVTGTYRIPSISHSPYHFQNIIQAHRRHTRRKLGIITD